MKCVFVAFVLVCTLLQLRATGGAELQREEEMLPDDGDTLLTSEQLLEDSNGRSPTADVQSSYYYAQKYDGQVIYIESYRWRGRWLDASKRKGSAYFKSIHQDDVVDHLGVKWLVKNVGNGNVVLESMKHKRHYLDAHHSKWCKVTYSSYPQGQNWARFKIEKSNGRFFFRSDRYPKYRLDAYQSWTSKYWAALTTGRGVYAQFRIYIPPKQDYYKEVFTLDNSGRSHKANYQLVEKIGVSFTNGREISTTLSAELGGEIKKAFSFGLTFSTTWRTFHTTTYSKETTHTVSTTVGPGKILKVLQLVGTYGHFLVRAKRLKFVTVNVQANTQEVVYANGMEEYNRGEVEQEPDLDAGPPDNRPGAIRDTAN